MVSDLSRLEVALTCAAAADAELRRLTVEVEQLLTVADRADLMRLERLLEQASAISSRLAAARRNSGH